jgi:hypothetical protein
VNDQRHWIIDVDEEHVSALDSVFVADGVAPREMLPSDLAPRSHPEYPLVGNIQALAQLFPHLMRFAIR